MFAEKYIYSDKSLEGNKEASNAYSLYKNQEYKKAFDEFYKLIKKYPDNAAMALFFGKSALKIEDYDSALVAFDRVIKINPYHIEAKMLKAQSHFKLKEFSLAYEDYLSLLKIPNLPSKIKNIIKAYLSIILKLSSSMNVNLSFSMGLEINDNIYNDLGSGISYTVPSSGFASFIGTNEVSGNPKRQGYSHAESLNVQGIYDFGTKGGWFLDGLGVIYSKLYPKHNDLSLLVGSTNIGLNLAESLYKISFTGDAQRTYYASSPYSYVANLNFKLSTQVINKSTLLNVGYAMGVEGFDDVSDKDKIKRSISVGMQSLVSQSNNIFIALNSFYKTNKPKNPSDRTDTDFKEYNITPSVSFSMGKYFASSISYEHAITSFDRLNTYFKKKQRDERHRGIMSIVYNINSENKLNLSYSYLKNNSNVEPYRYTQGAYAINYSKVF